jgi:cytochrome c biogenesis protein CcdA
MEEVKFLTVFVTALIDSINPCAIGVLVILATAILSLYENKRKLLAIGFIYIGAVYISYLLAGLGLVYFLYKVKISDFIGIAVAVVVVVLGLIEMKDYFWYGKGFSLKIPEAKMQKIKKYTENITVVGAIILGFFVSAVELPCTGGPYLAITTILSKNFDITAFYYLLFYNFIFVLPLIIIILAVYIGVSAAQVAEWKNKNKAMMRLVTGIIMVALGVALFLHAMGYISL